MVIQPDPIALWHPACSEQQILDQALHKPLVCSLVVAQSWPCPCCGYTRGRVVRGRNIYLLLRCRTKRNVMTSPKLIAALPVT